ncbi:MAG: ATP-binding protein [Polyangiales bacterium]
MVQRRTLSPVSIVPGVPTSEPPLPLLDRWTRRLVDLHRVLLAAPPTIDLLDLVAPSLGAALRAERVAWLDLDRGHEGAKGRVRYVWTPRGIDRDPGPSQEELPPRWMSLLGVGALVEIQLASLPDGERAGTSLPAEGAVLLLPVEVTGATTAVLRVESDPARRAWSGAELQFARDAARALSTALERQRHEQAERQQMQSRLLLADRMVTIGALAAGVAHEINNPLTFTLGNLEFVREELPRALEARDLEAASALTAVVVEALEGAFRVERIVTQLRKMSRNEAAEAATPVDLRAVLETAVMMAGNQIRHRARLERTLESLPLVWAQEARLGQVFINLLVNAAQAIPEGNAEANRIAVHAHAASGGRVFVDVTDTGVGVAEEIRARIFDAFFTTKPVGVGTGLGLSICQEIVREVGGDIELLRSRPGETTFRVTLDAAPGSTSLTCTPRSSAAPPPPGARVLVVDDEAAVGRAVRRLLRGHQVDVVADGTHALGLLAAGRRYDVILCDLLMPEFDGAQLFESARRVAPESASRFVFLTGGAFTARARDFLASVTNPCLTKPFDVRALRSLVDAHAPVPDSPADGPLQPAAPLS